MVREAKVFNIIKHAHTILSEMGKVELFEKNNGERKMITAINLVLDRLKEFKCIYNIETIRSDKAGIINLKLLQCPAYEILEFVDKALNKNENIICYPTYIEVEKSNTEYIITYNYEPERVYEITDSIILPSYINEVVLAYGVVSDILLANNDQAEANFYNEKFINAIKLLKKMFERGI